MKKKILNMFNSPYSKTLWPEIVMSAIGKNQDSKELHEIRRCFTRLKNEGLIYRTKTLVTGNHKVSVHTWKLTEKGILTKNS